MSNGIFNLASGAAADIAAHVDDEDFIRHINLALVHIVKHFFGAFSPDLIISGMAEESDGDDNVSLKGKALCASKNCSLKRVLPQRVMTLYLPTIGVCYSESP